MCGCVWQLAIGRMLKSSQCCKQPLTLPSNDSMASISKACTFTIYNRRHSKLERAWPAGTPAPSQGLLCSSTKAVPSLFRDGKSHCLVTWEITVKRIMLDGIPHRAHIVSFTWARYSQRSGVARFQSRGEPQLVCLTCLCFMSAQQQQQVLKASGLGLTRSALFVN